MLKPLLKEDVKKAFGGDNLNVFDNSDEMFSAIKNTGLLSPVYLFMSSGDFNGYDITEVLN